MNCINLNYLPLVWIIKAYISSLLFPYLRGRAEPFLVAVIAASVAPWGRNLGPGNDKARLGAVPVLGRRGVAWRMAGGVTGPIIKVKCIYSNNNTT